MTEQRAALMQSAIRIFIIGLLALSFYFPSLCFAQTTPNIDRATEPAARAIPDFIGEKLQIQPEKIPEIEIEREDTKLESAGPVFFISDIELTGVESFSPEEFQPIIKEYENKQTSLDEIKSLAKKIEREYIRRGVIAACFIPPQEIKDGKVILQVVEAKLGKLEIRGNRFFDEKRIDYYWAIKSGEIIKYDELSKSLYLINKNPDREAKVILYAGEEPGTTNVILDVDTRFPFHITSSVDREGSVYTGKWRQGIGARHNNFLGFDDTLLGGVLFGENLDGYYVYHSVPISNFGTSLTYGYSYSKSFPQKEFVPLNVESESELANIALHQDVFDEGEYLGEVFIGLVAKNKTITQIAGITSHDKLRVIEFGGTFFVKGNGSFTTIQPKFSQGFDILGAKRGGSTVSDADETFSKINLNVRHKRILPAGMQGSVAFKGQTSLNKLPSQEQFSFGGINSIRGYPPGDYLTDHAVQINTELLFPAFFIPEDISLAYERKSLKDSITGLIFLDYGYGQKRGSPVSDNKDVHLASVGGGVRIRLFDQVLLRLECGVPIAHSSLSEDIDYRLHFSLDFEDKFPEAIERMNKVRRKRRMLTEARSAIDRHLNVPSSQLRNKVTHYRTLAQHAYEECHWEIAKKHYEDILVIAASLKMQSQVYTDICLEHVRQLEEYRKQALMNYKKGDLEAAQNFWEKIVKEGQPKAFSIAI